MDYEVPGKKFPSKNINNQNLILNWKLELIVSEHNTVLIQ